MPAVPEYLVELYVSRDDAAAVRSGAKRARLAAEQLSNEGARVHYLRSLFLPEEETCFYLYEAESAEHVREAARRAALPVDNVVEAISEPKGAP